ncbi:DNA repair exonuclease [bacterium]|nr:DNA repair exonuclease [bacterium]
MAATDTTILFVGDMHLGRLPSRVPLDAGGRLPTPAELGPGAAWRRAARTAVELGVDAVALAGDVVHGSNDLFEGANELDAGLAILAAARIPVVAVAGNHDTHVLPGLARRGALTLLGEGGAWSWIDLAPAGRAPVRLVGWSFPAPHWEASPLAATPPPPPPGVTTLGLLHADLDVGTSRYAPVAGAALRATGYAGWFLGHVHRPGEPAADGSPFYLGSLTGLDPGETGRHGPVLVRVGSGRLEATRLPLAPLLWLETTLDLSAAPEPARDLPQLVRAALEEAVLEEAVSEQTALTRGGGAGPALAVGVRLTLAGEVAEPAAVRRAAAALTESQDAWLRVGGATCFLEKLAVEAGPRLDLTSLAGTGDAAGLVARRLLALAGATAIPGVDDPAAFGASLLREARVRLAEVDAQSAFAALEPDADPQTARREALAAARLVLEHLLATRGGRHAPGQG